MPRSTDGRWIRQCQVCGKDYHQLRPDQITCSVMCRAKLPHNTGGRRAKAGLELRACGTCGEVFQPVRDHHRFCSPGCYRQSDEWKQSVKRQNMQRRIGNAANPEVRKAENFRYNIRRYGLTIDEYEARLAAQGGVCMICGKPPKPNGVRAASRLHIDHDHETGLNRDLICLNCNRGLGYFKDDPALMRAAAEYIERHRAAVSE